MIVEAAIDNDRRDLYPPIEPRQSCYLQVDDLHSLYVEESGNPSGAPAIFLHGGPGGGTHPKQRQFFDPNHYRIILFDQRGSGKSKPYGEVRQNTTELMVGDIEKIREHLKIERWHVFGGSWGSTLAISYAIAHPERVVSMTMRGIFLMTGIEIDWFLYGMGKFFPEQHTIFTSLLTKEERNNILPAYYRLLTDPDPAIHLKAASTWAAYEGACVRLVPQPPAPKGADINQGASTPGPDAEPEDPQKTLAIARMEAHYFFKNRFKPDNYLTQNIGKIRHIPCITAQGRYDVICPPDTAYELHKAWPEMKLVMIPDAGHASSEPGITDALVRATDHFRSLGV